MGYSLDTVAVQHRDVPVGVGCPPFRSIMEEKTHRRLAILPGQGTSLSISLVEPEDDEQTVLQVGELAKATGKTVRAIHLYEDMKLLKPAQRSRGRFRLFNRDSIDRVRWISKMQAVGFSLPELQHLLEDQASATTGKQASVVLRRAYVEKLREVQAKLSELHRLEQELLSSLTYLDACQSACEDEALKEACPECSRHADQPAAPPLVSGARVR